MFRSRVVTASKMRFADALKLLDLDADFALDMEASGVRDICEFVEYAERCMWDNIIESKEGWPKLQLALFPEEPGRVLEVYYFTDGNGRYHVFICEECSYEKWTPEEVPSELREQLGLEA